jgi:anthranilate synthase component 1
MTPLHITPSLEEARELAATGNYDLIPVSAEIYADDCTPIQALRKLQKVSKHCFLLESVENSQKWNRYTFLGFDPQLCFTCAQGNAKLTGAVTQEFTTQHPENDIRALLAQHRSLRLPGLPPFTGGLVGYFSYDYITYAEPTLNLDAPNEEGFKDVDLMLFDKVIAFDNLRQKIILIANARAEHIETTYHRAVMELENMRRLLLEGEMAPLVPGRMTSPLTPLFNQEAYAAMVRKAKQHIFEGDIFQVVLSNRLQATFEGSLLDTYRVLRTTNPSPYMFYFTSDDIELAGASPETLVKLEEGELRTYPLAGTRPRGATPEEDARIEAELLADEKELAEHNMLVDLGRNDLGKISQFGTVEVENYLNIERFSHVMHIGSTVHSLIREDADALDAVSAVLPAGTLSGAPKLKACQIINDLEGSKRGVYGGAVGYLDFTGNLDLCIAIRLVFKKNGKVFVRSGAGIVADSDPDREYQECINKARAVCVALETAQGGIA